MFSEALYVDWFVNDTIVVGYRTEMGGSLAFVNVETKTAYKAPLELNDEEAQYYTTYLTDWDLLLVTTRTQAMVEVYGKVNGAYAQLSISDETRAVVRIGWEPTAIFMKTKRRLHRIEIDYSLLPKCYIRS